MPTDTEPTPASATGSAVGSAGSVLPPPGCPVPERPAGAPAPGTVLSSHYDQCMGCGIGHPTGLRMRVVAGPGLTVTGGFTLTEHHQGAPGLAHGGLLALALDEVLGGLGWLLQTPMVTGRLQVEYARPVPIGTTVDLDAEVVGVTGRRIFCRASARTATGAADGPTPPAGVLARAHAVFVAVPLEHFRQHGRAEDVDAAVRRAGGREGQRDWEVNP